MQLLGFKSLHYEPDRLISAVRNPTRHQDFRVYDDVDFACDIPAAFFWRQLSEAYPGLKLILTVRSIDDWHKSLVRHYTGNIAQWTGDGRQMAVDILKIVYRVENFSQIESKPDLVKSVAYGWNNYLRNNVSADRLLVLDICAGDRWEKLCRFLGKEIPDESFPHENAARTFAPELVASA